MKIELNELEPLNMGEPGFWDIAFDILSENPDKVLPVYLEVPESKEPIGDYFIRVIYEGENVFIQVEGFSSIDLEEGFLEGSGDIWKRVQPGIYRLDATS